MKLLIFASLYYPFSGGYVQSLHELAKRLVIRGMDVTLLACNTHGDNPREEVRDGVRVLRVDAWNSRKLNETFPIPRPLSALKIILLLSREKFDIVSTQTRFFPLTWIGFLFAKIKRIPVIHTERGGQHTASGNMLVDFIGRFIDHTFGWLVCRFSNQVIGVSEAACAFAGHLGAKNPIKIYNGVDCDFWQLTNLRVYDTRRLEVTFVGRLIYAKGVQDLLQALASLKAVNCKPKVNIVGDGPYRKKLEELTDQLNIKDQVCFWGELEHEKIKRIFAQTSIFVNPSHSEGLPRSVLEAAAVGLSVIATDVGGTRDIILSEDCGLLVPPGNVDVLSGKIILLMNNLDLRRRLAVNLNNHVKKNFSVEGMTSAYEKIYSDFNDIL